MAISLYNTDAPTSIGPTSGDMTISFDVGSDANRKLIVKLSLFLAGTNETGAAITAGGVSMRQRGSDQQVTGSNGHTYLFELDAAGGLSTGTLSIVATHGSGSYFIGMSAACYNGVTSGNFDGLTQGSSNISSGNPFSQSVTTSDANCWVVWMAHDQITGGGSDAGDSFTRPGSAVQNREHAANTFIEDSGDVTGAGSVTAILKNLTHNADWDGFLISLAPAASGPSAALTGTITASATEADIVTGGKTIILTLTNDTWIPS